MCRGEGGLPDTSADTSNTCLPAFGSLWFIIVIWAGAAVAWAELNHITRSLGIPAVQVAVTLIERQFPTFKGL